LKILKITLLALAMSAALTTAVAASGELPDSTSSAADEAFWKGHFLKLNRTYESLSQYQMTAAQKRFDVTYYEIKLVIDPALTAEWVTGAVTVYGSAVDSDVDTVELDFSQYLPVDSVKADGDMLVYQRSGNLLTISLPQATDRFAVTVFYQGHPQNAGLNAFNFSHFNGLRTVATLSEPFFARDWWPCKDHPTDKADSVDMYVTIDSNLIVVSNGTMVSAVDNQDGTKTTHWHESYPIATYLVSLAIAEYYVYSDTLRYQGHTMPIDFFLYDEPLDWERSNNAKLPEMLTCFSDLFGIYPFIREKFGHAEFKNISGGMEHQTCTSLSSFDEGLIVHELAHQWWGDMITCGSWHDIWINEGFATYGEALWAEHKGGNAGYHGRMNKLIGLSDGSAYVSDTTNVYSIFEYGAVYARGAVILHTLRYTLGDSLFFRTLRTFADSPHKYGTAVTDDFRRIAEEVSGRDLTQFFGQWVYESARPNYLHAFLSEPTDSGFVTYFFLDQTQTEYLPFKTDIDVRFVFADSAAVTVRLTDTLVSQNYVLLLPAAPIRCDVDPDNWILNQASSTDFNFRVMNNDLAQAFLNVPYREQLVAAGGTPPYIWSAPDVTLPDGLELSETGMLSGTPDEFGVFNIPFHVSESGGEQRTLTKTFSLVVGVLHGDIDGQPRITLSDLIYLLRYLYRGGSSPPDLTLADTNCDGSVDLLDAVLLLNYLYGPGPLPCFSTQ
jgi:hypothetical protein